MTITKTIYARLDETILITRAGDTLIDRADSDVLVVRGDLTDITGDVLTNPAPQYRKGIPGKSPNDRTATTGSFQFSLNNSAANDAGLLGAYSPDNSNKRAGFGIGTKVLLKMTNGSVTRYTLWRVAAIEPEAGQYGARTVRVRCVDKLDELSTQRVGGLKTQTNKRGDEAVTTVLDLLNTPVAARSIGMGDYTFPTVFDTERNDSSTLYSVINKICISDLAFFYICADNSTGELAIYESDATRAAKSSSATFNNTMAGLKVNRAQDRIFNEVRVTTYPRRNDIANVVLTTLDYEVSIPAGQSVTMTLQFRDPEAPSVRVSALSWVSPDLVTPDYRFSSVSGDSGSDLNTSLSIYVDPDSVNDSATVRFTNVHASTTGYINLFQLRGRGVKVYSPASSIEEDEASQMLYGKRTLNYNMPYQPDPLVGATVAAELLADYKDPVSDIDNLQYYPTNATLEGYALGLHIGDKITVTEPVTGVSSAVFFIQSEEMVLENPMPKITYGLLPV